MLFWQDLERHNPGISSLHLPAEVASAWKQRLRTKPKTITSAGRREDADPGPPAELLGVPDPGPRLLPGPGPVGCRGSRQVGAMGRALPDPRGGDQHGAKPGGTASHAWTPAPASACLSCRS